MTAFNANNAQIAVETVDGITLNLSTMKPTAITVKPWWEGRVLRPPQPDICPGWLAPNGDYYACNYEAEEHHGETAELILRLIIDPLQAGDIDNVCLMTLEQHALMELGWIRVDNETILPSAAVPTPAQLRTLRVLQSLPCDNGSWDEAVETITFFLGG